LKKLGILFLFAGIALGIIYPWAKVNFLGKEITQVQLTNLNFNAKQSATFELGRADNPVRARFLIKYKRDAYLPPVSIPVFTRIDGPGNLTLATTITFPTDGRTTAPEQGKIVSGSSFDFEVKGDGLHKISLELAPNRNAGITKKPDIENITVKFIANAAPTENPFEIWAVVLGALGFYLMLRGRRGREKPKQSRWGRGG